MNTIMGTLEAVKRRIEYANRTILFHQEQVDNAKVDLEALEDKERELKSLIDEGKDHE